MTRPRPPAPSQLSTAPAVWSESLFRPVRDGNVFEATVERIAQAIKLGVVPLGARLAPERELAETLQVSRMTLREAIRALADAGFVVVRRGRGGGTFVTFQPAQGAATPSPRGPRGVPRVSRLLDFRRVVEPGTAALAADRQLTEADRSYLLGCAAECEAAALDGSHRIVDSRLHLAIAGVTGCSPLVTAIADIQSQLGDLLGEIPVLRRNIEHSHAQHRAVVNAILAGDPVGARTVMEQHCEATSALLRGLLG